MKELTQEEKQELEMLKASEEVKQNQHKANGKIQLIVLIVVNQRHFFRCQ